MCALGYLTRLSGGADGDSFSGWKGGGATPVALGEVEDDEAVVLVVLVVSDDVSGYGGGE